MPWDHLSLDVACEFASLRIEQEIAAHLVVVDRVAFAESRKAKDPRIRGIKKWGDGALKYDRRRSCGCRGWRRKRCRACAVEWKRCLAVYRRIKGHEYNKQAPA